MNHDGTDICPTCCRSEREVYDQTGVVFHFGLRTDCCDKLPAQTGSGMYLPIARHAMNVLRRLGGSI
jgi:hypothetical protein